MCKFKIMENSKLIYKYRTWNNSFHKEAFIHNQIYFASPKELNDPFDFRIFVDYKKLDTPSKVEKYVEGLIRDGLSTLIKNKINPNERKQQLINLIMFDRDRMQDEFDNHSNIWTENRFGVVSFSKRWDSILMWSHYSENHKGFCIGYNKEKLTESKLYGSAGMVDYKNEYPSIDPLQSENLQDIISQSHTKAIDWGYEEEYRLTKLWDKSNPSVKDRITTLPKDFIEEVILGLLISKSHQSRIITIAKQKNIKVFRVVKKRHEFILDRVEL